MSSFDEYYNQWKKDNKKERKPYLPTSSKEISTSANNYIDNVIMPKIRTKTSSLKNSESKRYEKKEDGNILNTIGKTIENGWLSMQNGFKSAGQTIGRAILDTQANRADFWNEQDKKILQDRIEKNPEEKVELEKAINNPLISGEQIRKDSEEATKQIDDEKRKNQEKIQSNVESINNPVGKYIAGNIIPAVGQMLPGMLGGGVGSTYFISSATGNYYDDAKQRGMSEEQAKMYSGTMGIIEGSLETLGAKLTTNVGKQLLKRNIKGALVNYGLDIGENFLEEAIVEPISELVAETTAGKEKANWENIGKRFLQSGVDGAVTSMITGGVSGIVGGVGSKLRQNKYVDVNTGKLLNKNSQNLLKEAENIIREKQNIDLRQKASQNRNMEQINKLANNGKESYNDIKKNGIKNSIEPYPKDTINSKVKLDKDEIYYNGNDNKGKTIYFRLDNENGFKGKEHKSGVSMWEDRVDDYIYNSDNQNEIQSMYGIKDILELNNSKLEKLKREIAEDNGWITDGASAFRLNEEGLEEFVNYIKDHPIDEYEEINFFTGEENGFGADGEYVIKPNDTIYTNKSKNILEILEDDDLISNEKLSKIADIINNTNLVNNQETLYNDIALGETKNVPIEELLSLQTEGGYRNQEQITNLREDISKNGIQTPIELVRNNDGSITIENGNHRLQIAKELGIKEVPVKFVDSWDNIGIDSNIVKKWEDIYNGNNQNRAGINKSNEGTELFEGSVANNRNQLENGATATTNDRLFDKVQAYNDGTSSNSTFEKNNQELEESSSINLAKNRESQNKTAQDEYDMPYRDDVKIKNPKQSSFYKNAMSSELLNPEAKREISKNQNARFYEGITNKETFVNASETLNSLGENALSEFNSIENKNATAEDVALGLQLMKKYQDKGDYVTESQIAGKLREIGTESGQTVQAFSILQRMSPEGVLIYTQRQIENAKKEILKNKSQSWIDKNQEVLDNLNLTQEEAKKIVENMKEVNNTDNQRQKEILLGEVQKIITDKIPATLGDSFKAYRRISMLFNPKTIVRNITGNVGVAPINMIGDSTIGTLADKLISKKTGMRTTGTTNLKTYGKGFKEGAVQAFDDFRRGINTRDINGDKFEIGSKGKSFNDNKRLGKALNKIDALTNFSLDVGDRPFFKAEFMNELENLMKLNNVSEPTVDMIETATKVAEQRTWQDSNKYSDTVLNIRKGLNGINIGGVGFGDIVIPFAKTPANLTKAIVDYSPLGVVNAIVDANKLNKATSKGKNTAIMQKKLVDDISKAFMGSMLYIIGTGLAKAGITSGEADDDKDIANFEKNVLGIQPYSIKIGDKSFTYDWAQPLAAPLGITANLTKKNKSESAAQSIFNAISQGGNMLYEQSFLQNLKKLLDGDDIVKGSIEAIADIPSSLVPTFIKQIAEVVDPKARTTYEYNNIPKTALNKVVARLPFASKTLQPATDTMGRSIMKNGAEEGKIPNIFNIFLNPATTAKRKENPSAEEIYRLYKETGDKTVFPRVAPYYETLNKEKVVLTPKQKTKIQQISGTKANSLIAETIKSNAYKKLSDEEKVKIINDLVDYSFGKATNEVIKKDLSPENKSIQKYIDNGLTSSNAVIFKNTINNIEGKKGIDGKNIEGSSSGQKALAIMKMNVPDEQKNKMLSLIGTSKNPETVNTLSRLEKSEKAYTDYFALNKSDTFFQTKISRDDMQDIQDLGINQDEFMKFAENIGNIKSEKDKNGKTISGSKKKAVFNYIDSLDLKSGEKAILFAKAGYPDKSYREFIYNYINGLDLSSSRKKEIWDSLGYK